MTDRLLAVVLWTLGVGTVLIVTFAIAAVIVPVDALGTTLPRSGWVVALIAWGVGGGVALLALARVTGDGDRWPARAALGVTILAGAVAVGVAIEVSVMRWAADRFGVQAADPDLIGWSSVLSPMVVLVGLGALAGMMLPGAGGVAGRILTIVTAAGVLLSVASNVPGAADGITPLGVPMGIAMAAGAVIAVAAVVFSVRAAQLPER